MKPRHKRMAAIGLGVVALGAATALVLSAFEQNLVFFSRFAVAQTRRRKAAPPHGGWWERG